MSSLSTPKPVMQFHDRGVSVAIWKRQHQGETFHDVSITRSYKKDERWKRTSSFRKEDLPLVMALTKRAQDYLAMLP